LVDDLNSRETGRRRGDDPVAGTDRSGSDPDYFWDSKPGDDFGPIPPPSAAPAPGRSRRSSVTAETPAPQILEAPTRRMDAGPDGRFDRRGGPPPAPRRSRRGLFLVVGLLALLVGMVGGALLLVNQQGARVLPAPAGTAPADDLDALRTRDTRATATAATPVAALATSTASPAPFSPTPLILTQVTPAVSPAPARTAGAPSTVASPAARTTPVIAPLFPSPVPAPSGPGFATSTPARLGGAPTTPAPTRTAPPVPTARPVSFSMRVWSEPSIAAVGSQVSVCGSAASGATAEIVVIAPDRASSATLGQIKPPTERACLPFVPTAQGLYVLTIVLKDGGGVELDRQAGTLWVGR